LVVRVTPRGGRDAVDGVEAIDDGRTVLRVRVRAAAEAGEANKAVIALLAKWLGVAKRDLTLMVGHAARVKHLAVAGDPLDLAARLERLTAAPSEDGG